MDDHLDYTGSSPRIRKKGGRGPGKKDTKEKPGVSVRWEEADLTDRLIQALHANELWAGVFIATSTAEHSRAVIGMPKSDLQREIARHLFAEDQRFDLEDNRTIDLLGTSVKNKVNKIRKLYNECKDELGSAANTITDSTGIPPDSELGQTWARVKEKLPQYLQVRDIMNRPVVSSQGLDMSGAGDGSMMHSGHPFRPARSVSTPFPMESPGLHYSESPMLSPMQPGTSHLGHNGRAPSQPPHLTGPAQSYVRYYPPPVQPAPPRTTFSTGMQYPMQQATPASLGGGGDPSIGTPGGGQPHHVPLFPPLPMSAVGNPSSAPPPPLQIPSYHQPRGRGSTHGPDSQGHHSPAHPLALPPPEDDRPRPPSPPHSGSSGSLTPPASPPLTTTLFSMFKALESRKRQREEEYMSMKRMKIEHREMQRQREERERQRWHEREMLRLQIQLEKYKQEGEAAGGLASAVGHDDGGGPPQFHDDAAPFHHGDDGGASGSAAPRSAHPGAGAGSSHLDAHHQHSLAPPQHASHLAHAHTHESHERSSGLGAGPSGTGAGVGSGGPGERGEHENSNHIQHARLGLDVGPSQHHHSIQPSSHARHVVLDSLGSAGPGSASAAGPPGSAGGTSGQLTAGDAALDALTSLREGLGSGGLR